MAESKMKMKTIMVMHKDPDTRRSIKTLLEKNKYNVVEVISFEDFEKKIEQPGLDLVLIDGLMPRKKIIEITAKKNIKTAYFISDYIDEKELELYKNVIGFVDEPRDINKFLEKIKQLLKK